MMSEKEREKIESIIINEKDWTKMSMKFLKGICEKYYPNITYSIFNEDDTCFCSLTLRKKYRNGFISFWSSL